MKSSIDKMNFFHFDSLILIEQQRHSSDDQESYSVTYENRLEIRADYIIIQVIFEA